MPPRLLRVISLAAALACALLFAGARTSVFATFQQDGPSAGLPSIDGFEGLQAVAPSADDMPGYTLTAERVPAGGPPSRTAAYQALWVPDGAPAGSSGINITLSTFDNVADPQMFVENYFANQQSSQVNQDPSVQLVDLGPQGIGDEDDAVERSTSAATSYTLVFHRGRVFSVVSMFGPADSATLDQVSALAALIDERLAVVPQ